MTEDACAFYCGAFIAVCVAVQVAILVFQEVRMPAFYGAGIYFVTSFVIQQAHDYLGVSWRVLFVGSFFYFMLVMCVGEHFSRRRRRRHKARMAEFERAEKKLLDELEGVTRKLRGEEVN